MANNEEMKSAQAQSSTNQLPKPPKVPENREEAITLFNQIKQGVVGIEKAQAWVFQFEQPLNREKPPVPNPKTKFSEPVSCPPVQSK